MTTSRASLCALGEYLRRHCVLAPLREQVQIPQKSVRYRPIEKVLDGLLGLLCGAKPRSQSHGTMRVDPAVQRAFGRTGCAEPSTIARTLQASTPETVAQLSRVSWYSLKRYGQTPHHRYAERLLWVDVDITPLPIGAKAEGSERTWMGRNRSKTGRKTLRVTARDYREILHETLLQGKASAVPALQTALREIETRLAWTPERLFALFPNLAERRGRLGSEMSGGEQQMLTVARTLMGNPLAVLLDEPSEGVAPLIVEQMANTILELKHQGLSILLSEQNIHFAALVCDRVYVLEKGHICWHGSMAALMNDYDLQRAFLTM